MSVIEDEMVKRLEELNVPEFVIDDAITLLSTDEEQQQLLDFIQEDRKYDEISRKTAEITLQSGYGEDFDDYDELEVE